MVERFKPYADKKSFCLWVAVLSFLVSGCAPLQPPADQPKYQDKREEMAQTIERLYPEKFKVFHRVVLTLFKKDYVLQGYLSVDRSNRELKLLAQNDLGGTVFSVHYIKDVTQVIESHLKSIKSQWLEKTLLRDLITIYLPEPFAEDSRVFSSESGRDVIAQKKGKVRQEMIFKPHDGPFPYRFTGVKHYINQECVYAAEFDYEGKQHFHPRFIQISDAKMHYQLKIKIRYFFN